MTINTDLRYKKPSEEIVRDLIWYSCGLRLPPEMITFGKPEPFEPYPNDPIHRNTVVRTSGIIKKTRYFKGSQIIRYCRLNLNEVANHQPNRTIVIDRYPFTTYDILDQVNEIWGLMLSREDVIDTLYESHQADFVIRASPDSLVWIGELDFSDQAPNILTKVRLNGFKKYSLGLPRPFLDGFKVH